MTTGNHFNKIASALIIFFAAASFAFAQTVKTANPRQEKLLNNLKILMWQDATTDKATVKLRIHSGAAFDTLGKEGTMALLADALFPNESVKEYFREDLGGELLVESNYDYIQINASGNADQILTILETVAVAATKPTLDKETTAKVKTARLAKIQELEKNPAYVADLAVAKRLFGDYPYGRSADGTPESLAKIDFADLILAKQRFLTADNATIAVSGNIKYDYVLKALRQLFGGWEKADKKVPATFAQPTAPNAEVFSIESPNAEKFFGRYAIATAARNGQNYYATKILTEIWNSKICSENETNKIKGVFEPYLLRGIYFIGSETSSAVEPPIPARSRCPLMLTGKDGKLIFPAFFQNDFDTVKARIVFELNEKMLSAKDSSDMWLDIDTYNLGTFKSELQRANSVTLAEVQKVAEDLQKQTPAQVSVRKNAAATP